MIHLIRSSFNFIYNNLFGIVVVLCIFTAITMFLVVNNIKLKKQKVGKASKVIVIEKLTDKHSRLTVDEYSSQIESITISMNTSLREIGMFQDMYDSIKKNNNIPDNWNEKDFEKQEIANMVRSSFRIAIQDLSASGRVSKAAVEYWEQLGIHPQSAEAHCRNYLQQVNDIIKDGKEPDVRVMYEFLDGMAEKFKDSYKFALDRIGLKELGSEEFRNGD